MVSQWERHCKIWQVLLIPFLESLWRANGQVDEKPEADNIVCDSNFRQKTRKENVFMLYPPIMMY